MNEAQAYAQASEEYQCKALDPGALAKARAFAKGDEAQVEA